MNPTYAAVFDHEENRNNVLRIRQLTIPAGESPGVGMQVKMKRPNGEEAFVTIKHLGTLGECNVFNDSKCQLNSYTHNSMLINNSLGFHDMIYDCNTATTVMQPHTSMTDYYEGRIQQMSTQITEMTTQISELTSKNETLESEKADLAMQNTQLDTEMNDLMTQYNDLKDQLQRTEQEVVATKASLTKARASMSHNGNQHTTQAPGGSQDVFDEFKKMLTKIQESVSFLLFIMIVINCILFSMTLSQVDQLTTRPAGVPVPTGIYKKTMPLPPNNEIEVDREGYQHAACSTNVKMFTRRLVCLIFTFDEIFSGTVNGKKKIVNGKRCRDSDSYILNPAKINIIIGKCFIPHDCNVLYF